MSAGWIAAFVFSLILFGCSNSGPYFGSDDEPHPTRLQLLEKAKPFDPKFGAVHLTTASSLKVILGEPADVKLIGNWEYWYFECSDGLIQIQLIDTRLTGGQAHLKSVNLY